MSTTAHSDHPLPPHHEMPDLHEAICRRAEKIYFRTGCVPGRDVQNWTQAELEIRAEWEARKARSQNAAMHKAALKTELRKPELQKKRTELHPKSEVQNFPAGNSQVQVSQPEKDVVSGSAPRPAQRPAVVVKVNGVRYIGEYTLDSVDGYTPGEFASGAPVPVRFVGNKMFITRPNGSELETTIVKRQA